MMEGLADMVEGKEKMEEPTKRMEGTMVITTAVPSIILMGPEEVEGLTEMTSSYVLDL